MARPALVLLSLALSGGAQASVTVIYDTGRTIDATPYVEDLFEADPTPAPATLPAPFPVHTPEMQPARLTQRLTPAQHERLAALSRPVVLLGSDLASRRWLAAKRETLVEAGALLMLVEAPTPAALEAVQAIAGPLPLLPRSASDIATSFGLRAYPVVLSPEGISQ